MTQAEMKIRAVVLGHAVGDALGVPVEFCEREALCRSPVTDMRGFGTYSLPAGCFSDDTSMALAALDSLGTGTLDFTDIMERFAAFCYEGAYTPMGEVFDIGITCEGAIENYCKKRLPLWDCAPRGEMDNGNGALMRIYPFVLFAWARGLGEDEMLSLVQKGTALTHAHERAILASEIYALVLFDLLKAPSKDSVVAALKRARVRCSETAEYPHLSPALDAHIAMLSADAVRSTGYAVDTLQAALWCLLSTHGYQECVLRAVNLGGDTDTLGAVVGALAGALYGIDAIPSAWQSTLKKRELLEGLCARAVRAWTKEGK